MSNHMDIKPVAWIDAHKFKLLTTKVDAVRRGVLTMLTVERSFLEDAPLYPESALLQAREEGRREGMREATSTAEAYQVYVNK